MALFSKIRGIAGNYALKKAVRHNVRKKRIQCIEPGKRIGILFEFETEEEYQHLHDYTRKLQKEQLEVKVLGLMKNRMLENQLLPVITFDFIKEKDVNWLGKPKSLKFSEFVGAKFDICLDLSPASSMALKFAVAESNASYKVGLFQHENMMLFDMFLKMDEKSGLKNIITEVDHYLRIIKPDYHE